MDDIISLTFDLKSGDSDSKLVEGIEYYDDMKTKKKAEGTFKYCHNTMSYVLHGKGKKYYENGKVSSDGIFKNNQLDGIGIIYFKNGGVLYEGVFDNGKPYNKLKNNSHAVASVKKSSTYKELFDSNGNLLMAGNLGDDGKFVGRCQIFHDNGQLLFDSILDKGGELNGYHTFYFDNGRVGLAGTFKNSLLHGYGAKYTEESKLLEYGLYENGEFVEKKIENFIY